MANNKSELILLESYLDEKEAFKSRLLLEKNNISHKYFCSRNNIEKAYLTSNSNPTEIWVKKEDFEYAYSILNHNNNEEILNVDINNFSDEELIDIIKNPDEWHKSFINEANKIAKIRKIEINNSEIESHIKQKLELIKHGKDAHPATIFIFWLLTFLSVFFVTFGIFGFIFGFLGIIAGYLYWKTKITAPDNKKYYLFSKNTRLHGKYMFFVGTILMFALLSYVFFITFN